MIVEYNLEDVILALRRAAIHAGSCPYFAGIDNPGIYAEPVDCDCWVKAKSSDIKTEPVYVTNSEQHKVILNEGGQLAAVRIAELESQLFNAIEAGEALALQAHLFAMNAILKKHETDDAIALDGAMNAWRKVREEYYS